MSVFQHSKRLLTPIIVVAAAVGVIARGMGLFGALWLDEVWSCLMISSISSPIEVFTTLLHDNNHLATSLWIYLLGPFSAPELLRFPSLIFGVATLAVIAHYAPRLFGQATASIWLLLCLISYPLTLYSSEARGYGLLMLCATWSFMMLLQCIRDASHRPSPLLFAAVTCVGFFSHATFAISFAAFLLWATLIRNRPDLTSPELRTWLLQAFIPPIITGGFLGWIFYSRMKIGGAPILPYIQVLISAISVTFGGEELSASNAAVSAWCVLLALFVTIFLLSETIAWFREDKDQSSLIALLLLAPLGAVVVLAPHFIMFRYFLFQSIILLLIAARFLIRLASRGSFGALVSTGLVCGFIYGNFRLTWELLTIGRSFFEFNRRTILHLYPEQQWTLGATQVFQTELRLQYGEAWFAAHGSGYTDRMILVADYNQADPGPLHVLRESVDRFESFPDSFVTSAGITYMRAWINRAPLLSGAQAAWYQREDLFRERHPGMRVP